MVFSATTACARCRLRFSRRATCPSCGGDQLFALTTREGRLGYRAATRTKLGLWGGVLLRLAPWAPRRAWLAIGASVLAMLPAAVGLATSPHVFQTLWLMDDLTMRYEGISSRGFGLIGLAFFGAVGLTFTLLARHGSSMVERDAPAKIRRMCVYYTSNKDGRDTTLTGIARKASVEIESPVSGEPCLIFAIRGEVGDADVADAEGGDFDLELPTGERVMISLEHATLEAPANEPVQLEGDTSAALDAFLEERGIGAGAGTDVTALEEHLVRDGDEVTVIGKVLGGTVTSLGYRGASRTRVLAGDEEHPVVVQCSAATAPSAG